MSSDIGPDITEDVAAQKEPFIKSSEQATSKIKPELINNTSDDLRPNALTKDQQAKKEAKEEK